MWNLTTELNGFSTFVPGILERALKWSVCKKLIFAFVYFFSTFIHLCGRIWSVRKIYLFILVIWFKLRQLFYHRLICFVILPYRNKKYTLSRFLRRLCLLQCHAKWKLFVQEHKRSNNKRLSFEIICCFPQRCPVFNGLFRRIQLHAEPKFSETWFQFCLELSKKSLVLAGLLQMSS